jgi:hypothetical protein
MIIAEQQKIMWRILEVIHEYDLVINCNVNISQSTTI